MHSASKNNGLLESSASEASLRRLISEPTLKRLPWYLAYVRQLHALGVERVSSTQISRELNVDASQIAKDLSMLCIRGKTRIGYDVALLQQRLEDFLCFRKPHPAVIFGVGSLGAALISDVGLMNFGLDIVAGFDVDPKKLRPEGLVPVYNIDSLAPVIERTDAKVGIITVPSNVAQYVADLAVAAGVTALWNFSPTRLRPREGVVIQNTSLYSHLAIMYNRMEQLS